MDGSSASTQSRQQDLGKQLVVGEESVMETAVPGLNTEATEISYYIENLPETHGHRGIRYLIRKVWKLPSYKELTDVFIPRERNLANKRYGYVRFKGVVDKEEMKGALGKQRIGASQIACNFARPRKLKSLSGVELRPIIQAQDARRQIRNKGKVMMDIVVPDVLKNQAWPALKSNVPTPSPEKEQSAKKANSPDKAASSSLAHESPVIEIEAPSANLEWLKRGAVGILRDIESLPNIQELLTEAGWKCDTRVMGRGLIWLEFPSKEEAQDAIESDCPELNDLFSAIFPWSGQLDGGGRLAWVHCVGIPIQVWGFECFEKLAFTMGKLVNVDEQTMNRERLDIARLLIVSEMPSIRGYVRIRVAGIEHSVWCQEEPFQGVTDVLSWMSHRGQAQDPSETDYKVPYKTVISQQDVSSASKTHSVGQTKNSDRLGELEGESTPDQVLGFGERGDVSPSFELQQLGIEQNFQGKRVRRQKFRLLKRLTETVPAQEDEGEISSGKPRSEDNVSSEGICLSNKRALENEEQSGMWVVGDKLQFSGGAVQAVVQKFEEDRNKEDLIARS